MSLKKHTSKYHQKSNASFLDRNHQSPSESKSSFIIFTTIINVILVNILLLLHLSPLEFFLEIEYFKYHVNQLRIFFEKLLLLTS